MGSEGRSIRRAFRNRCFLYLGRGQGRGVRRQGMDVLGIDLGLPRVVSATFSRWKPRRAHRWGALNLVPFTRRSSMRKQYMWHTGTFIARYISSRTLAASRRAR